MFPHTCSAQLSLGRSGKNGPHGELLFFTIKVASKEVLPNPFVSAETLKARALISLHLLAAEGEAGSSGSQSPDSGDMWRYGCPKSPDWDGDVKSWTQSEGTSSSERTQRGKPGSKFFGARPVADWERALFLPDEGGAGDAAGQ